MKKNLDKDLILVGVVNSAHGIRGDLVIKCFGNDPKDLFKRPVFDKEGNIVALTKVGSLKKDSVICRIEGCLNRNKAETMKGMQLFCLRSDLPDIKSDKEFYIHDLKNSCVKDEEGVMVGVVNDVANYGAGDIIEIKFTDGQLLMFPFTEECFPRVCAEYIQINLKNFINLVK